MPSCNKLLIQQISIKCFSTFCICCCLFISSKTSFINSYFLVEKNKNRQENTMTMMNIYSFSCLCKSFVYFASETYFIFLMGIMNIYIYSCVYFADETYFINFIYFYHETLFLQIWSTHHEMNHCMGIHKTSLRKLCLSIKIAVAYLKSSEN